MEYIGYKNRFKLVWDALFNNSKLETAIRNKVYKAKEETRETIQRAVDGKLKMMQVESRMNTRGIGGENQRDVLVVPLYGVERRDVSPQQMDRVIQTQRELKRHRYGKVIDTSFTDHRLPVGHLMGESSRAMADMLMKEGLIFSEVKDDMIRFYVNVYK